MTQGQYTLSDEDIECFNRDGFLVIPASKHQTFDPAALYDWAYEIKAWPKAKGKWMSYDEINSKGERQLMRTEFFTDYHQGMNKLLREGTLPRIMGQLFGSPAVLFKDKINYKAANGNGFKAHMDGPGYDRVAKVDHGHLTVNIAVDQANMENGCLEVVSGSHKMKIARSAPGPLVDADWEEQQTWVPVPLEPGDFLIFGSLVAHRSAPNHSNRSRASIYATYNSILDGEDFYHPYYTKRRETFPPENERVPGVDYKREFYASAAADL